MPNPDGTPTADELSALAGAAGAVPSLTGDPNVDALLAAAAHKATAPPLDQAIPLGAPAGPMPVPGDVVGEELAAAGIPPTTGISPTPAAPPPYLDPKTASNLNNWASLGVPNAFGVGSGSAPSASPAAPGGKPAAPQTVDRSLYNVPGTEAQAPNPQGTGLQLAPPFPGLGLPNALANARQQQGAAAALGDAKAGVLADQAAELVRQNEESRQKESLRATELSAISKERDDLFRDIQNSKIDPHRIWRDKSAGETAGTIISILLSGIGSGMSGGTTPNLALQVIDKQIERDINAQTAELGKKENLLGALVRKYGDVSQAQEVQRAIQRESFARGLVLAAAKHGGAAEQAQARLLAAQVMAPVALKMDEIAIQRGMAQWQYQMQQQLMGQALGAGGGGQGGGKVIPSDFRMPPPAMGDPKAVQEMVKTQNEHRIPGPVPGTTTFARTPHDAEVAKGRLAGVSALEGTLDRMESLAKNGVLAPGEKKATYNRLRTVAAGEFARMLGGTPSADAMKEFEEMFPGNWESSYGSNRLAAARDSIYSAKVAIYGAHAGVDPKYIPVPTHGGN